MIESSQPNFLR